MFVEFKDGKGEKAYVNPAMVRYVEKFGDNESLIWFGAMSHITVNGKPSSVVDALNCGCTERRTDE